MKPQNTTAPGSGLINDVVAAPPAEPVAAPLAEPPKEATFVEAPIDAPAAPPAPTVPVAELAQKLPTPEAKSSAAVVKTLPRESAAGPSMSSPMVAIAVMAGLFVVLAAVAIYAYSKTV